MLALRKQTVMRNGLNNSLFYMNPTCSSMSINICRLTLNPFTRCKRNIHPLNSKGGGECTS